MNLLCNEFEIPCWCPWGAQVGFDGGKKASQHGLFIHDEAVAECSCLETCGGVSYTQFQVRVRATNGVGQHRAERLSF